MAEITFISFDGTEHTVSAEAGVSLMQAAVENGIDGIPADCGGACSCATCHCYIEAPWMDKVGEAADLEKAMLEHVMDYQDNSRLSCQVTITAEMDGMRVAIPENQY